MAPSLEKMPTTTARRLTSLFERCNRLAECIFVRCWGEVQVRQHVGLAVVDAAAQLGPLGPEWIGDIAQALAGAGGVGLHDGLAQRGRDHAVLAPGHI